MTCRVCGAPVPDGARFCPACGSPVTQATDERRIVTVVFADLVGFTSFSESRDPERVKNLVDGCFERLAAEVTAHGGRVDKIVGDAIVALFGAPRAHEDDAERAVRSALRMQETVAAHAEQTGGPIEIRVGVNTGEVLVGTLRAGGDVTAMGDVVNTANRLQGAAPPGTVLVGPQTYEATRRTIAYEHVGPVDARGRDEPVEAWRAVEALGLPGTRPGRTRTPLVGRDAELGMLRHAIGTAVERRRPQLVLLVGEAGVGKSRLAEEAADIAAGEHGALVLEGRCLPYGEASAWWPLAEALRSAFAVDPSDDAETAVEKTRTAVTDLFTDPTEAERVAEGLLYVLGYEGPLHDVDPGRARDEGIRAMQSSLKTFADRRPLVVLLSELHWAEGELLELVDRSFERLRDLPVVLLATARPELADRWTPQPGRHNLLVLNLDPLDPDASARLLAELWGAEAPPEDVTELVMERGGGNPLFLEELVALLTEPGAGSARDVPASLRGLVAARLDALSPTERSILEDAAVVGRSGPHAALEALAAAREAPDEGQAVDTLVTRDLLTTEDGNFAFKSELVRDVAYETLTKAERARRHAALGAWLAERARQTDREEEGLERIAHHYGVAAELAGELGEVDGLEQGLRERALGWLERAAERAEHRETFGVSVHLFEQALRIARPEEGARWRSLMLGRAQALADRRDLDGALSDIQEVRRHAEAAGDRTHVARALTLLGDVRSRAGRLDEARETLQEAVRMWQEIGDRRGEAEALRNWGLTSMRADDLGSAEDAISQALGVSRALGDRRGEAWALQNLAWVAFYAGRHAEAEHRLQASQRLFSELGDIGGEGWALGLLGYVRYFQGDLAFAEQIALGGIDWTRETGDRWAHGMMLNLLAGVRLWTGRCREAADLAKRGLDLFDDIDDALGKLQALAVSGWAHVFLVEMDGFAEESARAMSIAAEVPAMRVNGLLMSSSLASQMGAADEAAALAEDATDLESDDPNAFVAWTALALARAQQGRPEEGVHLLEEATIPDTGAGQRAHLNCVLALAYAAAGRPGDAIRAAAEVNIDGGAGSFLDRTRAFVAAGLAEARRGRPEEAEKAFDRALELIDGTEDVLDQAIVRLARAHALAALGDDDAAVAEAEARGRLERLGVEPRGWETLFGLAVGADVVSAT